MALIAVSIYIPVEYRFAQKPASLANITEYAYGESTYSISDLTPQERTNAELTLRRVAATAVAGYHIADERFFGSPDVSVGRVSCCSAG
jgi:hypothetical protein